jgi:sterol desaturase/sphingolipid hydroxylase (fatty acid hydroxylase superfamily)
MTKITALGLALLAKATKIWLSPYTLGSLATIFLTFAFIAAVTARRRGGWRSLLTRDIATDACWTIFYLGGFYAFFIGAPVYKVLALMVGRFAPWLRASLLVHIHPVVHFMILWLAIDLTGYWWHRLAHRSSLLWQFHRVHHSQTDLQPLTNYRFHFVDLAVRTSLQYIPAIVLGSPTGMFLSAVFIEVAIDGLAHADVSWSYGVLGKLIMNPAFHRIHHSTESRHFGRNFGLSFSIWDRIFGTAVVTSDRPRAYGVDGQMPQSFARQIFFPFGAAARALRRPLPEATPEIGKAANQAGG